MFQRMSACYSTETWATVQMSTKISIRLHWQGPPHLTGCSLSSQNDSTEPLTHVTNLAVLSHFFKGELAW